MFHPIEKIYTLFQKSSGVKYSPFDSDGNRIYFALKHRIPDNPVAYALWRIWCGLELYAPAIKQLIINIGLRFRFTRTRFLKLNENIFDGNAFVQHALENGTSYAVIDNPRKHHPPRTLLVEDVHETIYELVQLHRQRVKSPIVAITGSAGKTTTTGLTEAVLKTTMVTIQNHGVNSPVGLSMSVLNIPNEVKTAVFEMGTAHPGIIQSMSELVQPTHGLITAVGRAHLNKFGTPEAIQKEKWELFKYLNDNNGVIFLNNNDKWLTTQRERLSTTVITYGSQPNNDIQGHARSADPYLEVRWLPNNQASPIDIQTKLAGRHNLDNVLGAIAVGVYFGVPADKIKNAIEQYEPVEHRSSIIQHGSNTIYDESFIMSPTAVLANLNSFAEFTARRKVVIVGPLIHTLPNDPACLEIAHLIRDLKFDQVIFIGDQYDMVRSENIGLHLRDQFALEDWLHNNPIHDSHIMLKAYTSNEILDILLKGLPQS